MATGVTSQWEDIHVKKGNFEAKEKQPTLSETYLQALDKLENTTQKMKDEDLDSLEDEMDEAIFQQYTQQRMKEMMNKQQRHKYGVVYEISRDEYVREVTEASKSGFVVLHLYQDYVEESVRLNQILIELAAEHGDIKFIKMVATKCIEKFQDDQVPCFIIYKDGKVVSNLPMVHKFVRKLSNVAIEHLLIQQGVLAGEEQLDEEAEELKQQMKKPFKNNQTEVDDDNHDREYSHNINK